MYNYNKKRQLKFVDKMRKVGLENLTITGQVKVKTHRKTVSNLFMGLESIGRIYRVQHNREQQNIGSCGEL